MDQNTRKLIRNRMARRRHQLTLQERQQKAKGLLSTLTSRPEFIESRRIAAYWPVQGEMDPLPLIQLAFQLGKRCYLPVLHPSQKRQLLFYEYCPQDLLIPNRYGIPEPLTEERKPLAGWMVDLVLVPLLAFNKQGQRLGRGAGHYDYSFAFLLKEESKPKHPKLIGLAYEFQQTGAFPQETWDVPLYGIATEKRFIISGTVSLKPPKEMPEHPCQ